MPLENMANPAFRYISTSNPYTYISNWWGEPLSNDLINRAGKAPLNHLVEFRRYIFESPMPESPKAVQPGEMRPLFLPSSRHDGNSWRLDKGDGVLDRYFESALTLLLYSHQALLQDPLSDLRGLGDQLKPQVLAAFEALLKVKPLADANAFHFIQRKTLAYHPGLTLTHFYEPRGAFAPQRGEIREALDELDDALEAILTARGSRKNKWRELFHSKLLTGSAFNISAKWPGSCNLLARSEVEDALLHFLVRNASYVEDGRNRQLQKLIAMSVPGIMSSISALTSLRQSAEDFAEWRAGLTSALNTIGDIPNTDEDWAKEARSIVFAELAPIRERLEKSVSKSPAMSAMKKGAKDFTLSGFGTLVGALVGGRVMPALVGAAAGKSAEVLVEYVKKNRERRSSKAILDVTLKFVDPSQR